MVSGLHERMRNEMRLASGIFVCLLPAASKCCGVSQQGANQLRNAVGGCSVVAMERWKVPGWRLVMVVGIKVCGFIYVARIIYALYC